MKKEDLMVLVSSALPHAPALGFPLPCPWHCGSATQSLTGCQAAQLGSVSHVLWIRQVVSLFPWNGKMELVHASKSRKGFKR